jgi:hypothetical protein
MADLKLAKTEITPMLKQRIERMRDDAVVFQMLSVAEIRAVYSELEETRDILSRLLDAADGKNV